MTGREFDVYLTGELLPGYAHPQAVAGLAKLFRIPPDTAALLVRHKPHKIKAHVAADLAQKYVRQLNAIGVASNVTASVAAPVDAAHAAVEPESPVELTPEMLQAAFTDGISREPAAAPASWTLTLTALLVAMSALFYLLTVLALSAVTVWHAAAHASWLARNPFYLHFGNYLGLLLAGSALVIVMVKPLALGFVRPLARQPLSANRHLLPQTYVREVAHAIGAAFPRQVYLVMEPVVAARPLRGVFGLLSGEVELYLGLPLLASSRLDWLAGAIAHELSYFSDQRGNLARYVIVRVNAWYERSLHQRDYWDEWLEAGLARSDRLLAPLFFLAQAAFGGGKYLLALCARLSALLSHAISRDAMLQADRWQCALAGSESFCGGLQTRMELETGYHVVQQQLLLASTAAVLDVNLVERILSQAATLSETDRMAIAHALASRGSPARATTVAAGERCARAAAEPVSPVCGLHLPAQALFRDFAEICRQLTELYYQRECRFDLSPERLADRLAAGQRMTCGDSELAPPGCQVGFFNVDRVIVPQLPAQLADDPSHLHQQLAEAAAGLQAQQMAYHEMTLRHAQLQRRLAAVHNGRILLANNIAFNARQYALPRATANAASAAFVQLQIEIRDSATALQEVEDQLARQLGLELACVVARGDSRLAAEVALLVQSLRGLRTAMQILPDFHMRTSTLENLTGIAASGKAIPEQALDQDVEYCLADYRQIIAACTGVVVSAVESGGDKDQVLADRLLGEVGDPEAMRGRHQDLQACYGKTRDLLHHAHQRLTHHLAQIVAGVEQELQPAVVNPPRQAASA